MKNIDLSGDIAGCFDAARQEAEKQPKTDVSEDVKDARSMTSEEPCDGGARILIDLAKLDQFATEYAQDKYLPVQTKAAVVAGATWVCKNPCPGSLSGLLTNDLTGEFQKKMQKTMAEVMANDKIIKFASQWEEKPAEHPKEKAGNWYICFAEVKNKDLVTVFSPGETYFCPKDGYLDVDGALVKVGNLDAFRLFIQGEEKSPEWRENERIKTFIRGLLLPHIEDVHIEGDKLVHNKNIDNYRKALAWLGKQGEQKPAEWSEEDKKLIDDTCHLINTLASGYGEKVTEPITLSGTQMIASIKDRLRALVDKRPQNHWKPSGLQIEALESATENCAYSEYQDCLRELATQLKKLK